MERFFARVIGYAHHRQSNFVSRNIVRQQTNFVQYQQYRKFSVYQKSTPSKSANIKRERKSPELRKAQSQPVPDNFEQNIYNPELNLSDEDKAYLEFASGDDEVQALSPDHNQVLMHYNNGIKLLPNSPVGYQKRANFYLENKRYDECIADLKKVIEVESNSLEPNKDTLSDAWTGIGMAYLERQILIPAVAAFTKAYKLVSNEDTKKNLDSVKPLLGDITQLDFDIENLKSGDIYYRHLLHDKPVKLKIGSEKGRGLYAAKDFEIGQTVFRESPIISYISPFTVSEEEQTYCANCGQTLQEPKYRQELSSDLSQDDFNEITGPEHGKNLIQTVKESVHIVQEPDVVCNKCTETYCSSKCFHESQSIHNHLCTSNDQVAEFEDYCIETESEHSLFIAKIYAQLYVDFKQGKSPLWTVLSHMCRVKNNDPSFPENEEWALNELKKIFPPEFSEKYVTKEMFWRLKSLIALNSTAFTLNNVNFTAYLENNENMGLKLSYPPSLEAVGLFPLGSLLNHSCEPNVGIGTPVFNTKMVSFVALKPIKEGDELVASYSTETDIVKRREFLYHNYYFWCRCPKCTAHLNTRS